MHVCEEDYLGLQTFTRSNPVPAISNISPGPGDRPCPFFLVAVLKGVTMLWHSWVFTVFSDRHWPLSVGIVFSYVRCVSADLILRTQNQTLISSSLTALGVKTPDSVINAETKDGGC